MKIREIFIRRAQSLLSCILLVTVFAGTVSAATLTVDDSGGGYPSIQAAINAASTGDTILVYSGIYTEQVAVNKQLILLGMDNGGGKPIVSAGGTGSAITLSADGITLDGFVATNGTIGINIVSINNNIKNNYAIYNNGINATVNGVPGGDGVGINLGLSASNNNLTNNVVKNNIGGKGGYTVGAWTQPGYGGKGIGIHLGPSASNNNLMNNVVKNNIGGDGGDSDGTGSSRGGNGGNGIGIDLESSPSNNSLTYNDIEDNKGGNGGYSGLLGYGCANSGGSGGNAIGISLGPSSINTKLTNNIVKNNVGGNGGKMYVCDDGGGGWRGAPGGNGIGISLESSFSNNNLSNNIAVNNMGGNGGSTLYATGPGGDGIGIYSRASNNNTFIGNIVQYNFGGTGGTPGNGVGIYFSSSDNNTYSASIVQYNNNYGIYLSSSNNNTIYNNRFNNSNNFITSSSTNIWNITKTQGTNVAGGPYLGGNFWENPDGTGYSRECTDADSDGICNFPYTIGTDTDYLPLSMYSPTGPTPTIITTVYDNYFNDTNNFGTSVSTRWNITKTLGTNIVGGPYLGGNFWANSVGTGYSQTCTDADWDGICDLPYTLGTDTDYLPLSMNYTNAPVGSPTGTAVVDAGGSPIIPSGYGKYQSEALDVGKNVSFITVNPIGTGKINQAQVYTTYSVDGIVWPNWAQATRNADGLYTVAPGQYGRYFGYIIIAPTGVVVTQTITDYVVSPNGVIYII